MTAGPWRPIRLETYTYRIDDIRIDADLIGPEYKTATLKAKIELASSSSSTDGFKYKAVLKTAEGKKVKESTFDLKETLDWKFENGEVEAWWPIHYGKQPLYQLEITLSDKVSNRLRPRRLGEADRVGWENLRSNLYQSRVPSRRGGPGSTR